jgi:hypothetical protein
MAPMAQTLHLFEARVVFAQIKQGGILNLNNLPFSA